MIYCTNCGKAIPQESRFCTFCGASVPVVDPEKPNVANPSRVNPPNLQGSSAAPNYRSASTQTVTTSTDGKLEFYKNPGFYGALLLLIGFFLPWFSGATEVTGFSLLQFYLESGMSGAIIFIVVLMVLPLIGAVVVLIQSFSGALSGVSGLFKWLSFLSLAFFLTLLAIGLSDRSDNSLGIDIGDAESIVTAVGIGLWLSLVGCLIMLFNKRHHQSVSTNPRVR
jgi:hypothetical protein